VQKTRMAKAKIDEIEQYRQKEELKRPVVP
jgi:hypothetical protein